MRFIIDNRDENMYGQIVIDHFTNFFSCLSMLISLFFKKILKKQHLSRVNLYWEELLFEVRIKLGEDYKRGRKGWAGIRKSIDY